MNEWFPSDRKFRSVDERWNLWKWMNLFRLTFAVLSSFVLHHHWSYPTKNCLMSMPNQWSMQWHWLMLRLKKIGSNERRKMRTDLSDLLWSSLARRRFGHRIIIRLFFCSSSFNGWLDFVLVNMSSNSSVWSGWERISKSKRQSYCHLQHHPPINQWI